MMEVFTYQIGIDVLCSVKLLFANTGTRLRFTLGKSWGRRISAIVSMNSPCPPYAKIAVVDVDIIFMNGASTNNALACKCAACPVASCPVVACPAIRLCHCCSSVT